MSESLHSLEMEMATLGSFMLGDDAPEIIRAILPKPEMFYRPSHRVIYRTLLELMDIGLPADLTFCAERLGVEIQEIGGESYLFQIAEYVPSPSNAEHYAKMVLDLWAKRSLYQVTQNMTSQSSLLDISEEIDAIRQGATRGINKPVVCRMGDLESVEDRGVSTPWPAVDNLLSSHGFPLGEFCIVRAKTGVGKTPFLTQVAIEAARKGRKVVYATFADLERSRLQARMMKYLTGWSTCPTLNLELNAHWQEQKKYLQSLDITVYDATASREAKEIESFVSWLEFHQEQLQATDVCVDYIQEVKSRRQCDKTERLEHIADELKLLAAKLGIAIITGAQVSNNAQEGDMTKGGRDSDEKAAIIFDIKPNEDNVSGIMKLTKNRYGPKVELSYTFDAKTLKFEVTA